MATWKYGLAILLATIIVVIPAVSFAQPRPSGKPHQSGKPSPSRKIARAVKPCTCQVKTVQKPAKTRRLHASNRDRRALQAYVRQRQLLRAGYLASLRGDARRPQLLDGWQIRLIDGDTFAYEGQRIRIRGYNAPEVSEAGGFAATQRLDLLLREGPVTVIPEAKDVYGRTVADVFVNQKNVSDIMTTEGYAKK
jgi:hypothetical protein